MMNASRTIGDGSTLTNARSSGDHWPVRMLAQPRFAWVVDGSTSGRSIGTGVCCASMSERVTAEAAEPFATNAAVIGSP